MVSEPIGPRAESRSQVASDQDERNENYEGDGRAAARLPDPTPMRAQVPKRGRSQIDDRQRHSFCR